jgi:hypothetical protein
MWCWTLNTAGHRKVLHSNVKLGLLHVYPSKSQSYSLKSPSRFDTCRFDECRLVTGDANLGGLCRYEFATVLLRVRNGAVTSLQPREHGSRHARCKICLDDRKRRQDRLAAGAAQFWRECARLELMKWRTRFDAVPPREGADRWTFIYESEGEICQNQIKVGWVSYLCYHV